jgi:hypothetical protein
MRQAGVTRRPDRSVEDDFATLATDDPETARAFGSETEEDEGE